MADIHIVERSVKLGRQGRAKAGFDPTLQWCYNSIVRSARWMRMAGFGLLYKKKKNDEITPTVVYMLNDFWDCCWGEPCGCPR